jgi:DNA-binding transcriptional MerR regulator
VLKDEQVEACTHVRDMLTAKLDSVRQKIIELRKLESQFAADLKQCERRLHTRGENQDACPVLKAIAEPARGENKR